MIVYKEIEQRGEQWHLLRWGKIGGSTARGLYTDSDTLYLDVLSQHIEPFELEESYTSLAMMHGIEQEPFAKDFISKYVGVEFKDVGWIQSKKCGIVGISPDGITDDLTKACEIKCLGRANHTKVLIEQDIPMVYRSQIIHYFLVNPKLESLWFIAFRGESISHFIKEFTRDSLIDLGKTKKIEIPQFGVKGQPIKPKTVSEPDVKPISEWVKIGLSEALNLEERVKNEVERLKF